VDEPLGTRGDSRRQGRGAEGVLHVDGYKNRLEDLGRNMLDPWVKLRRLAPN